MGNVELWQVFVSLGVPGLALGVFYMLYRKLKFSIPVVPQGWAGPIVVLFLLLTSGVVLYALTLWAPQADEEFGVEANQQNNRVNQPGNFDSPNLNEEVNGRQREILNMEIKASDKHREEPSESTLNRQLVALRGKIGKKTTTSIFRI